MANLTQLRLAAREIFQETLREVNAREAVRREVRLDGARLEISGGSFDLHERTVYAVAIGKAAMQMAIGLDDALGERLAAGLIVGPISDRPQLSARRPRSDSTTEWHYSEGGHPLPTEASLTAAAEAVALLERANQERALVIFLISGGGSAMIESPIVADITLGDLSTASKALINSGASIAEINAVRRTFSAVKGGRLAAKAANCDQITLIISDVPAGEEGNVASGPTMPPPNDGPTALEVLDRYDLRRQMPAHILHAIEAANEVPDSPGDRRREFRVLLSSNDALEAAASAARRRGYITEFVRDVTDDPIGFGCETLLARLMRLREEPERVIEDVCVISAGEFSCPVRGAGLGGRNLESALRLAWSNSSSSDANFVALCAGTDGIDGNSPAAGAIVDSTTIERATKIGLDPHDFLNRSDAYSFFVALGDAITTGPTGTNVRDLRILLASNRNNSQDA